MGSREGHRKRAGPRLKQLCGRGASKHCHAGRYSYQDLSSFHSAPKLPAQSRLPDLSKTSRSGVRKARACGEAAGSARRGARRRRMQDSASAAGKGREMMPRRKPGDSGLGRTRAAPLPLWAWPPTAMAPWPKSTGSDGAKRRARLLSSGPPIKRREYPAVAAGRASLSESTAYPPSVEPKGEPGPGRQSAVAVAILRRSPVRAGRRVP